ncbi:hypothetical protein Halar_3335 [halophilic archaeon DL31]|jgi:DNA repair ATPase RecN|nr:hypothetical protein Halar_3335 [halophilic archaeon DL31]
MGLDQILEAAETVGSRDQDRQATFREEFAAYEAGETATFDETRAALAAEREALETLDSVLDNEESNIEEFVDETAFLTADQAVRHREATVEKLREHNTHLREFHEAMTNALDAVEENLETLERDGPDTVDADPEPEFERAYDALDAHNETIDGLGRNMTILNAYLI